MRIIDLRTGKESRPVSYYAEERDTSGKIVRKVRRDDILESPDRLSKERRTLESMSDTLIGATLLLVTLLLV